MKEHSIKNPWLGLESYQEGEVLYGRDDDIRDLIQCVLNDVDTLLYGKSGIGKSSILNAGILPAARRNGYMPVLIRLSHKENNNYLFQIYEAIVSSMQLSDEDNDKIRNQIREVVQCKDKQSETLYEFFHRHTFHDKDGRRIKLLIIFDQFEEIFTLQSDEAKKRDFFAQMADVLNDIMPDGLLQISNGHTGPKELINPDDNNLDDLFDDIDIDIKADIPEYVNDNDVHFVFTIREDFLSEFEYYTASIPSLKQNRYGLRPTNEEQASQIILRPLPGLISQSVAKLIIEKVTGRTDFKLDGIPEIEVDSAVLSLYLNRLYEAKNSDKITADLVEQKGGEIISDFYNEAISDISQSSIVYLEDMLINGQGRRDNITVYDAIHEGGLTQHELDILCNKNKILRQFNYASVLRIEYIHDILCPIIIDRKERREEDNRINKIKEAAKKEKLKSKKRLTLALSAFLLLAIGVSAYFLYDWYYHTNPMKTYYSAYELRNGWPVGVGPELSETQRKQLPVYYELSHLGHEKQQFSSVRVCSPDSIIDQQSIIIPMLLTGIIPVDSVSNTMSDLQSKIRLVTFNPTADTNGHNLRQTLDNMAFYGKDNNLLFTIKLAQDAKDVKWFTFYDDNGQPLSLNEKSIDRINVKTDSNGYVTSAIYYDGNGVKRPLWDNVYGYTQTEVLKDSSDYNVVNEITLTTINQFGQPTDNKANTTRIRYNQDNIAIAYFHKEDNFDKLTEVENDNGYSKAVLSYNQYDYYGVGSDSPVASMKIERNENGNITQMTLSDPAFKLKSIPAKTILTYDKPGRVICKEMLDINGKPFSPDHAVYKYSYGYSDDGEQCFHEEVADTGTVYFYKREKLADNVMAVSQGGVSSKYPYPIPFHTRIDSTLSSTATVSYYYDRELHPINYYGNHKVISNITDSLEEYSYYRLVDNEVVPMDSEDSYFRLIKTLDKDGNVSAYRTFDSNGNIIKSMMYFYDNGRMIGRAAMGIDSTPVRCDQWEEEDFLYYKLFFNRDFEENYTDFMAVNELSQPSLIKDKNDYMNIEYSDFQGAYLNCDNIQLKPIKTIVLIKHYWQYCPTKPDNISNIRMTYIHLLDKGNILYAAGLRDGDVIFSCGTWKTGGDVTLLRHQLIANNTLTVLQLNNGRYEQKVITLPRKLNPGDFRSVHLHNMNLSTFENISNGL